jgi:hypothetical protein
MKIALTTSFGPLLLQVALDGTAVILEPFVRAPREEEASLDVQIEHLIQDQTISVVQSYTLALFAENPLIDQGVVTRAINTVFDAVDNNS